MRGVSPEVAEDADAAMINGGSVSKKTEAFDCNFERPQNRSRRQQVDEKKVLDCNVLALFPIKNKTYPPNEREKQNQLKGKKTKLLESVFDATG